ncbi:MAG: T9SS type A sorting domain-containing protein [Bacteroidales bacterium]|nr:T9SS type A sorting domain-containing protein [Bacteroidales bacterium]
MKTIYKILLILCLTFISLINVLGQTDTLIVVNVVAVDTNNSGRYNALEIEFNQPLDDATMDIWSRIDDWYISNNPTMSSSDRADDFNTTVEYIATANQANDVFIRIRFDNPNGGNIADNTYDTIFIRWNSTNDDVLAYYTPLEFLDDTTSTLANKFYALDYGAPKINSVTSEQIGSGSILIVEDTIKFTVTPTAAETGLTVSPATYNGCTLNWATTDGSTYVGKYPVTEGDPDQSIALQLTGVTLEDGAGNVSASVDGSDVTKGIDANTPSIVDVTSDATGAGVLKVGDQITFTVDVTTAEYPLTVLPLTYNGQNLNWGTSNGGDTYVGIYTVTENDPDQDPVLQLTGVTLTDPAGNISSPVVDGSDVVKTIDANTPGIATVTSTQIGSGSILVVEDTIKFTVTLSTAAETGLTVSPATYNGRALNWTTADGGSTYEGKYPVTEGDPDQSTALQLTGVTLTDGAGNVSASVDGSDVTKGIDANTPSIVDVTSDATGAGVLKVGDQITFTVDVTTAEYPLTVLPLTYNGQNLNWTTSDGGDNYIGIYTVTENDPDQDPGLQLTGVTLTDPAGNVSSPVVDGNDVVKLIDANKPIISNVTVTPATMLYGQNYTITITVNADGDTYNLVSGTIAGFNFYSLVKDADDTYSVDFTVGDLGYDILSDDSYDVTNLVLSDPAGNLTDVYSKTITQAGDPIYTILPTAKVTGNYHVCDGDSAELSFQLTGSAPWEVELFDGSVPTTVSNINESPYYYKVESNNVLGYEPDTLIYKITQVTDVNGNVKIMSGVDSANVFIHKIPVVDITDPPGNKTYNINADADTLTGSPVDGVFSGNGIVSSNNTFLPSSAGLTTPTTPHEIVYTYTVPSSGCYDSDTVEFEVIESDAEISFENDDAWRCDYETTFGVTAEVITNPSIIGELKLYGAPAAITDHGDNTATIDVQQLSAGTYEVTFEYTDGTFTTFTESFTVEKVGDDANPINFTDLSDECEDYDTIFVDAINLIPSGGDGKFIFSGAGGAFEYEPTDPNYNSGYFLPGQVTPGSYTLKYVYTTPNGCESDSVIKYFDINALPNVSFTMNAVYNIDQGSSTIDGSPLEATGVFTPLSFMSNNGDGTADFDPADAGIGTWWVKYTYEDANACVNADSTEIEVNEALGDITSSSGSFQFCYYGSSIDTLTGTPNPTDGSAGSFYIDDILITPESDNKILFNPQDYLSGDHTVKFEYNNGPTNYVVYKTVNVDSIGNIYFTGLDIKYCENENTEVELTASYPGQDGVMKFTGNGITDDDVDNLGYFNPSDANLGDNVINYLFTRDYSGCQKTYNETVRINKIPYVAFNTNEKCIVNNGDSIVFVADTLGTDSIVGWEWYFRDRWTEYNQTAKQPPIIGNNRMILELTTNKGCTYYADSTFYIGTRVDLEFSFENECHGEAVSFELITSSDTEDTISTNWNFGGPGISDLTNWRNPTHQYTNPGAYNVIYEEYLKTCGRIADTVKITVRPSVDLSVGEYLEEFEDNSDITGWVIENFEESANNSWQWGIPTGDKINTASSGTSAYVTNLSGNYDNDEKGMITSPCFDFSSMQRPMMKMDFIAYTEEDRDGAVIQYTKPNGDWATIGVPNDGINWYNSYIITGEPADQQLGWTGEIIGDDNAGWQTAMYRLDELRGRAGVRFRIVFGSNGDFADEGFAFDNIQFSERKRIVLLENFTNINDDDANNTQDDIINPILEKDSLDVINLNYHTSFPTANTFNSYYPSGPSARALYYGVSAVPYSLVDGGERNYDYTLTNTLAESDIHKRMLIDPQFDISVRQDIQANNFVVSSSVKALEEMTGQNVIVYVAIVEKTVLDGADRYNNVLRTMLPDAAGILVEKDWIVDDSVNVYQTWSISEGVNTDSLITIVFVQDEDTKEIYQTGFTEEFSTITSVDEIIDNILSIDYIVYPNPVKEILSVKLYKSLTYDININVYNSVGALVKSNKLAKGNYLLELDTNDLPSGVYYLRLTSTDKFFSTKKIIISN